MDDALTIFLLIFAVIITFAATKFTDIFWRIKQQRRFQRKDYHLVGTVSKDKKAIRYQIFLPEKSTIWNNGQIWVVENNRIYREDKPDDGFVMTESNIKWRENIPILFVDEETFRPLDFNFKESTNITPSEAGAILKAWEVNQAAKAVLKAFAEIMQIRTLIYIALALSLIGAVMGSLSFMTVSDMKIQTTQINQTTYEIHNFLMPPPPKPVEPTPGGG